MRNFLLLCVLFIVSSNAVFALEIVYPKTNPVKINSSSTFFIGSVGQNETLKVNGLDVQTSQSGAFAYVVPLNIGINNFRIESYSGEVPDEKNAQINANIVNFVIERAQPQAAPANQTKLIEYPIMSNFYVAKDNVPIRTTPVDGGINRMAHLPKDLPILINGEKGNFYRVYLNSKLAGWIAKTDVAQIDNVNNGNLLVSLKEFKVKDEKDYCLYEFDLDNKTPFVVKEENGLTMQLFNIEGQPDNTYCLNIPIKKIFGYDSYFDGNKFVLKVRKFPQIDIARPLHDIVIAIDAGHGGREFGAIGGLGDNEKDINLAIAKNLQHELKARGAKVIMTRDEDINVSLADRVKIAKDKDATLLISIHANALPDGSDPNKNRGTSLYYYHNQAKPLADSILESMTTELNTQNDKVRQGSLALVRPTSSVSVLIEVGYIINPDDYALLLDKNFQYNCANSIADGIEKYILGLIQLN